MSAESFGSWEAAVDWLRSQPSRAALVRACYFDMPLLGAAQRYRESAEWQAVRPLLPQRPGRALDLGAGQGISTYALGMDGWNTTALEPDPSPRVGRGAIEEIARAAGLKVQVLEGVGEAIPVEPDRFDLVHARQVLHHAANLEVLCAEVCRVLRPGGMFVATREHVVTGAWQLGAFRRKHPLHHLYGGEHAFTLRHYLAALRGSGLEVVRTLGPFDSEVNLAPMSFEDLRAIILRRLGWIPGLRVHTEAGLRRTLRLLACVDHRAGRLYSFVARKPLATEAV